MHDNGFNDDWFINANDAGWHNGTFLRQDGGVANPLEGSKHPEDATLKAVWPWIQNVPAAQLMTQMRAHQREDQIPENAKPFLETEPDAQSLTCDGPAAVVGKLASGLPMIFPAEAVSSGLGIVAQINRGKTVWAQGLILQLILLGVLVIVFDPKGTWRRLSRLPVLAGRTTVLSLSDLKLSMGQPPPGCALDAWWSVVVNSFGSAYGRLRAHQLLFDCFASSQRELGEGRYPSLDLLIQKARMMTMGARNYSTELARGLLESLENMHREVGMIFSCYASDIPSHLFGSPGKLVIIEDHGASIEHHQFIIAWLLQWIYRFRQANRSVQGLFHPVQLVLEDASNLLDARLDANTVSGTSPIASVQDVCREFQIGLAVVVHSLKSLSPKIARNTNTWICCGVQGEDVELARQRMGLTKAQAEVLLRLGPGEAVGLIPSVHPHAVFLTYPMLEVPAE